MRYYIRLNFPLNTRLKAKENNILFIKNKYFLTDQNYWFNLFCGD